MRNVVVMSTYAVLAGARCVPFDAPRPTGPTITEDLAITNPECLGVGLVKMLTVSTDVPTLLTVELEADDVPRTHREIVFPTPTTNHEEPLLGLLESIDYTVTVTLTAGKESVT